MADTQTFSNIDAAKWERIKAAIKAKTGIEIDSNVGTKGAKGVSITWTYNPVSLDLAATLLSRKFFDPSAEEIDHDIVDIVTNA
ncbi:MAG TPA: hypothetical protein VGU67_03045 [Edaphobacter sp.]|nr:hypothetical protein [Edaphobacter sp.]